MKTDLREVDLNLLVVLDALLVTRSVTAAAQRLGMTQSGTSRALSRLRDLLGDPLFVVQPDGLAATPRCESVVADVRRCLEAARAVVSVPSFEPETATGTVYLGMPDHLALLFGTRILAALRTEAPQLDLVIQSFSRDWERDLRTGVVELGLGVLTGREAMLRSRKVLEDPWVVVLRKGHAALRRPWTARAFADGEHGLMFVPGTGPSQVDRALSQLGLQRRVVFRASSPLVVAIAAAQMDLKVTTTRSLALTLARTIPLEVRELPIEADPLQLPLVWHERMHHDPRHGFVRSVVAQTLSTATRT